MKYLIPFYILHEKIILFLGLSLTMVHTSGKWIFESRGRNAIYFHKIFNNLWHVNIASEKDK